MKKRKHKRNFEDAGGGLLVFDKKAYFNDYLEIQIGAKWQAIKNSLYDAGYTTAEVNAYRDDLLEDFKELCKEKGFTTYI